MLSFPQRAGNLLRRTKSRPLAPLGEHNILAPEIFTLPPFKILPSLEAQVVPPGSSAYKEARTLQMARFARASMPGESSYLETVDFAPERTIPLVVYRSQTRKLVGTARLELAGASIIEAVVRFQPDLQGIISQGAFAEVGGFATGFDLDWADKLDVVDTLSAAITQLADKLGIMLFFLFPRRTLMGLLLAQIPEALPPYRFTLVQDVAGWQEESPRLEAVRQLHVKALSATPDALPVVYAISPARWAEDVQARLAAHDHRRRLPNFPQALRGAMRQAQGHVEAELLALNTRRRSMTTTPSPVPQAAPDEPGVNGHQGFLPFPASIDFKAEYLQQVVAQGGAAVQQYKSLSYQLLRLAPGMQVLDVGCGAGVDLLALAEQVGQTGQVIGLDNDPDVLQAARKVTVGQANILLVANPAEKLPFLDGYFDRVRADRVLQHVARPAHVLTEMWRVLSPGGLLVLVEPDWKAVALSPGSGSGGEDDSTLEHVLKRYQRQLPHATIGRQLHGLLMQQGAQAWEHLQVQSVAFTLTAWPVVDTVLQLSTSAQALASEQPALKKDIDAWLKAVEAAQQAGTFLASIPLFFVAAQKIGAAKESPAPAGALGKEAQGVPKS